MQFTRSWKQRQCVCLVRLGKKDPPELRSAPLKYWKYLWDFSKPAVCECVCFMNRLGILHFQHCLCTVMAHGVIQQEEELRGGGGALGPPFLPAEVSAQTDGTVLIILHWVRAADFKMRFASLWYQRFHRHMLWFNSLYLFTLPTWHIVGNEERENTWDGMKQSHWQDGGSSLPLQTPIRCIPVIHGPAANPLKFLSTQGRDVVQDFHPSRSRTEQGWLCLFVFLLQPLLPVALWCQPAHCPPIRPGEHSPAATARRHPSDWGFLLDWLKCLLFPTLLEFNTSLFTGPHVASVSFPPSLPLPLLSTCLFFLLS